MEKMSPEEYILGVVHDGAFNREEFEEALKSMPITLYEVEKWMEDYAKMQAPVTVYEAFSLSAYGDTHYLGIFDSEQKAKEAKEQFIKDIENEKSKYPCPYPKYKNKYLRDRWVDDEKKNEALNNWYYDTSYRELNSYTGVFIREVELNKYHFLPNLRESSEGDKIEEL